MQTLPQYKAKLSHSAVDTFKTCQEKHYLRYIAKIYPKETGSSLSFGGAVDEAVSYLLRSHQNNTLEEGLKGFKDVFLNHPEKGWDKAFKDPGLRYSSKDYDAKVLGTEFAVSAIDIWSDELNTTLESTIKAIKQKEYKTVQPNENEMYTRLSWLSLREKGLLMLEAFVRDALPKIKRVVAIQHKIEGRAGDTDLVGYLDLIAELEGQEKLAVLDLKTSAMPYEQDDVKLSEQLTLYLAATGEELQTDLAGFIVLHKTMSSDSKCSKCNFVKESNHKTCNSEASGKRCGGEWISVPKATTQILLDTISKDQQDDYLSGLGVLEPVMAKGLRVKNFESCRKYGFCDYYSLCHNKDKSKYNYPENKA